MLPFRQINQSRYAARFSFLTFALAFFLTACDAGAGSKEDFRAVEAFPNLKFERPVHLLAAPDGSDRLFLIEQEGRVLSFENRKDVEQKELQTALDLRDIVRSPTSKVRENRGFNEEGLLGIAFHPDFEKNRFVFLHYSRTNPPGSKEKRRGIISRFEMDEAAKTIDRESEKVILEVDQFAGNHNGGMLAFGPDGYLYASFGDGGGAGDPQNNGQDLSTLLATILRIDIDRNDENRAYGIPEDNPFVDREDAREEIFAWGLRNVWRFSFDPKTGALWAGDVCQNAWEKIYRIEKGQNYGWPYLEGTHEYDGIPEGVDPAQFTPPIVEHSHSETRSITGGYVYHGKKHPDLRESFIYGDYVTGVIFALWYDEEAKEVKQHKRISSAPAISSFGTDKDGELYIVSLAGSIFQLEKKK